MATVQVLRMNLQEGLRMLEEADSSRTPDFNPSITICCQVGPQHKVAQVLNMKPQEILGMLEEAAGTRMYETKKEAALRTLEKKQVKVQEIEKVLSSVPPVNPCESSLDQ